MPHLNHRRGDTRRRVKQCRHHYFILRPHWNREASRALRAAVRHVLDRIRASGFEPDLCEDVVFPIANEADDPWNWD